MVGLAQWGGGERAKVGGNKLNQQEVSMDIMSKLFNAPVALFMAKDSTGSAEEHGQSTATFSSQYVMPCKCR